MASSVKATRSHRTGREVYGLSFIGSDMARGRNKDDAIRAAESNTAQERRNDARGESNVTRRRGEMTRKKWLVASG